MANYGDLNNKLGVLKIESFAWILEAMKEKDNEFGCVGFGFNPNFSIKPNTPKEGCSLTSSLQIYLNKQKIS